MAFFDNFSIKCNHCDYVDPHVDKLKDEFDLECPNCGRRWIIKFKRLPLIKRGRDWGEDAYVNGCTIGHGTF